MSRSPWTAGRNPSTRFSQTLGHARQRAVQRRFSRIVFADASNDEQREETSFSFVSVFHHFPHPHSQTKSSSSASKSNSTGTLDAEPLDSHPHPQRPKLVRQKAISSPHEFGASPVNKSPSDPDSAQTRLVVPTPSPFSSLGTIQIPSGKSQSSSSPSTRVALVRRRNSNVPPRTI